MREFLWKIRGFICVLLFASVTGCGAYMEVQDHRATPTAPTYSVWQPGDFNNDNDPDPEIYDCAQLTIIPTLGDPTKNKNIEEGDAPLVINDSEGVYVSTECEFTLVDYQWDDEPEYEKVPIKGGFLYIQPYLYESGTVTITVRSTMSKFQQDARVEANQEVCYYPEPNTQSFINPNKDEMVVITFSEQYATGNPEDDWGNHLQVFGTIFTPSFEAIVFGDTDDGIYIDQAVRICRMPVTEEILEKGSPYLEIDGYHFGWLNSFLSEDSLEENQPTLKIDAEMPTQPDLY